MKDMVKINAILVSLISVWSVPLSAVCTKGVQPQVAARSEVYAKTPFKANEMAKFEIKYLGILVGYGDLWVKPARKHDSQWAQVFFAEGKTGDWYKAMFIAHDKIEAISNPVNFSAKNFYMQQNEGKLFGSKLARQKWVKFSHENCKVEERVLDDNEKKKNKTQQIEFSPGAQDVLSVLFDLRTRNYQLGKLETAPVYTSEKNWELKAEPVAFETVKVPAGEFKAVKLKLTTYIGQELQQKGSVFIWIATEHASRPLVKVEGEIKIGAVEMLLKEFKPGA